MANSENPILNKETVLGFLEEAEAWQLQSSQFPSKVGGKPAWLSQTNLPCLPDSACDKCQLPTAFLLQVYAPITEQDRSFHRTVFVFCCKTPDCFSQNDSRCLKVYRSQLPRGNDFYPFDPPTDEAPSGTEPDPCVLGSGVKLCRLCGCPGQKACSRCHAVYYCSKEHQTIDWRHSHKKECVGQALSSVVPSPFLFPEFELVTEPEELPVEEDPETVEGVQRDVDCSTLADSLESELEDMAMHETQDTKVFQKFKQRIQTEPHQVLRYCRGGSPLWLSSEHVPSENDVPHCLCGSIRVFEFQVMPQLLNHLKVDSPEASIDWGTLAVYTCENSCDLGNKYSPEFIWKQDLTKEKQAQSN
ncbi:programmed cell death protein 2 [Hypomesus transpacificus]|uniref:programmed cell death protein 2 n=1 Tax=Hypomesus transpacificus TaxID=137520 RepID=UPI001F078D3C|nr:programmed cell death protein 2 [Hypomesus transpacificus]